MHFSLKLLPGKVVATRMDDISWPNLERRKKRWDQSVEDLVCLGSGEVRRLVRKDSSAVRCWIRSDEEEEERESRCFLRKFAAVK